MPKLRVNTFSVSLDGFGAGPYQDLEHPLGVGGPELFDWFFHTRTWCRMNGKWGGDTGVDDKIADESFDGIGAYIMGRNMFGPIRGEWPDEQWKGWWGEEPPYHTPVFVLTHHPRAPIAMRGSTEFRFVTGGIHDALAQAREAAGGRDVRIGGGVSTVRQYLEEGLIDAMNLVISPVLLGAGEPLLAGLDLRSLGYECTRHVPGSRAMAHVLIEKRKPT